MQNPQRGVQHRLGVSMAVMFASYARWFQGVNAFGGQIHVGVILPCHRRPPTGYSTARTFPETAIVLWMPATPTPMPPLARRLGLEKRGTSGGRAPVCHRSCEWMGRIPVRQVGGDGFRPTRWALKGTGGNVEDAKHVTPVVEMVKWSSGQCVFRISDFPPRLSYHAFIESPGPTGP